MKSFKNRLSLPNVLPLISYQYVCHESILVVDAKTVLESLQILKKHLSYQYHLLTSIAGVDLLTGYYRFVVIYELLSIVYNTRVRVKVFLPDTAILLSSTQIFINANWWEREIWDLFGIFFRGNNDLRRILTDYGFEGHPLRKDFPLYGYHEVRYNDTLGRIVTESVMLDQDYRVYSFENVWKIINY